MACGPTRQPFKAATQAASQAPTQAGTNPASRSGGCWGRPRTNAIQWSNSLNGTSLNGTGASCRPGRVEMVKERFESGDGAGGEVDVGAGVTADVGLEVIGRVEWVEIG